MLVYFGSEQSESVILRINWQIASFIFLKSSLISFSLFNSIASRCSLSASFITLYFIWRLSNAVNGIEKFRLIFPDETKKQSFFRITVIPEVFPKTESLILKSLVVISPVSRDKCLSPLFDTKKICPRIVFLFWIQFIFADAKSWPLLRTFRLTTCKSSVLPK